MDESTTTAAFSRKVLAWFDQYGRTDLPWQQDISPYRVWVSEIMLQQTQVGTVIGYFERFLDRFPTVEALAAANEDDVLNLWTGLGYYSRARNMHAAAQMVIAAGGFPANVAGLEALPGVGRSTAGAISSIAFGRPAPILDGNVKRVLTRYRGIDGWPGAGENLKQLWALAQTLMPAERCGAYTQAMMDLGATLCTRAKPACAICPINDECVARREGKTATIPAPKPRRNRPTRQTHMLLIESPAHEVLLEKRPADGIWGGLWSFPECATADEIEVKLDRLAANVGREQAVALPLMNHDFTHYKLQIQPHHVKLRSRPTVVDEAKLDWFALDRPLEVGLARPVTRLLEHLRTSKQT